MSKWQLALAIIELIKLVLTDSDSDGKPDLFDKEPQNPEVQ